MLWASLLDAAPVEYMVPLEGWYAYALEKKKRFFLQLGTVHVCICVRERKRQRQTHIFSVELVLQENARHTPAQMARTPEHHPMYNPSPISYLQPKNTAVKQYEKNRLQLTLCTYFLTVSPKSLIPLVKMFLHLYCKCKKQQKNLVVKTLWECWFGNIIVLRML